MNFIWKNAAEGELRLLRSITLLVGDERHLLDFLFDPTTPKIKHRPGILRDESWKLSHGERLLIQAALDLWSGSGHLELWEMVEIWDNQTWTYFILAICELKQIRRSLLEMNDVGTTPPSTKS